MSAWRVRARAPIAHTCLSARHSHVGFDVNDSLKRIHYENYNNNNILNTTIWIGRHSDKSTAIKFNLFQISHTGTSIEHRPIDFTFRQSKKKKKTGKNHKFSDWSKDRERKIADFRKISNGMNECVFWLIREKANKQTESDWLLGET